MDKCQRLLLPAEGALGTLVPVYRLLPNPNTIPPLLCAPGPRHESPNDRTQIAPVRDTDILKGLAIN